MGTSSFAEEIVKSSPIRRGLTKMATRDKEVLENRFNSAYDLAKKERPYSDFPDLIELLEKNGVKFAQAAKTNEPLLTLLIDVERS